MRGDFDEDEDPDFEPDTAEPNRTYCSDGSESISCPHCGRRCSDLWDYGWRNAFEIDVDCPHACGGRFTLTREVSVSYEAVALLDAAVKVEE